MNLQIPLTSLSKLCKSSLIFFCAIVIISAGCNKSSPKPLKTFVPFLKNSDKYVYVDSVTMTPINNKEYDYLAPFSECLGRYETKGLYGFVDTNGIEVVSPKYFEAGDFHEGLAWVQLNGKSGFIDKLGNVVVPLIYDNSGFSNTSFFSSGLARVLLGNMFGFIDKKGKVVIPLIYDFCGDFIGQLATVKQYNKWGCINTNGELVIPIVHDNLTILDGDIIKISDNGKPVYFNSKGAVTEYKEQNVNELIFESGGLYGLKDLKGNIVVQPKYDFISQFNEGVATTSINEKLGAIDIAGRELFPPKYDITRETREFYYNRGFAKINLEPMGKMLYIDKAGREYREISNASEISFLADFKGKYPYSVKLFQIPVLATRLKKMLGGNYKFMIENWDVEDPIDVTDNYLLTSGFRTESCCDPYFFFMADITNDALYVGISKNGILKIFTENKLEPPAIVKQKMVF